MGLQVRLKGFQRGDRSFNFNVNAIGLVRNEAGEFVTSG
jgi:hypothetical protein